MKGSSPIASDQAVFLWELTAIPSQNGFEDDDFLWKRVGYVIMRYHENLRGLPPQCQRPLGDKV